LPHQVLLVRANLVAIRPLSNGILRAGRPGHSGPPVPADGGQQAYQ